MTVYVGEEKNSSENKFFAKETAKIYIASIVCDGIDYARTRIF